MVGPFRRRRRRSDGPAQTHLGRPSHPAGDLRVDVSKSPGLARIALSGQFDIASADDATRALQALLKRGLDLVVVDLSGLDFMDSTGVRFLVEGRETARDLGVKLSLVHGGDPVRRVLEVAGVMALFEEADDPWPLPWPNQPPDQPRGSVDANRDEP
jgi:anti-anti-sigma factor